MAKKKIIHKQINKYRGHMFVPLDYSTPEPLCTENNEELIPKVGASPQLDKSWKKVNCPHCLKQKKGE